MDVKTKNRNNTDLLLLIFVKCVLMTLIAFYFAVSFCFCCEIFYFVVNFLFCCEFFVAFVVKFFCCCKFFISLGVFYFAVSFYVCCDFFLLLWAFYFILSCASSFFYSDFFLLLWQLRATIETLISHDGCEKFSNSWCSDYWKMHL